MFCSEQISKRQSQIDKLYAGLRDLAVERRSKLDEALKLFMLNREVDDLEQWIAEREVVAGSHELGQDYDHVTVSYLLLFFLSYLNLLPYAYTDSLKVNNETRNQWKSLLLSEFGHLQYIKLYFFGIMH